MCVVYENILMHPDLIILSHSSGILRSAGVKPFFSRQKPSKTFVCIEVMQCECRGKNDLGVRQQ